MPIVLSNLTLPTGLTFEGVTYDAPPGQQQYTTPGTYSWTAPAGVTSVSVVCVGGGGSGGTSGGPNGPGGGGGIPYNFTPPANGMMGGLYGGGAGSMTAANTSFGGNGAVRIIWGEGRAFPSTNTGNL